MANIEEAKKAGGSKYKDKIMKTIEAYKNLSDEDKHCLHIYYGCRFIVEM